MSASTQELAGRLREWSSDPQLMPRDARLLAEAAATIDAERVRVQRLMALLPEVDPNVLAEKAKVLIARAEKAEARVEILRAALRRMVYVWDENNQHVADAADGYPASDLDAEFDHARKLLAEGSQYPRR